jgi:hypothetical protein
VKFGSNNTHGSISDILSKADGFVATAELNETQAKHFMTGLEEWIKNVQDHPDATAFMTGPAIDEIKTELFKKWLEGYFRPMPDRAGTAASAVASSFKETKTEGFEKTEKEQVKTPLDPADKDAFERKKMAINKMVQRIESHMPYLRIAKNRDIDFADVVSMLRIPAVKGSRSGTEYI